ncbi:PREDICTED: uncharacterized protein LOC104798544 isoform X2 [Tarenaya hassleriana]|nr:PREDICTED: uncharacterized protein LOC104798544 isoform X2 [Tarenaya hassleriana]
MTDPSGGNHGGGVAMREYRKGNWTVSETMVLIEAKKMDDERRLRRSIGLSTAEQHDGGRGKPAELRWKWIEDYCWRKGCLRSQNQCNDKWDNLMRDYKKVREYERRSVESSLHVPEDSASASASGSASASSSSYWKMEKSERKERNLPSKMLSQIYDALVEVVEKKGLSSTVAGGGGGGGQLPRLLHQSLSGPMIGQLKHQIPAPVVLPLPPPPPPPPAPQFTAVSLPQPPPPSFHAQTVLPTVGRSSSDSDTGESLDTSSPAKRRRISEAEAGPSGGGGGSDAVGEAISRSAFVIADAIRASEERQDKRHKELVSLQERRLKIEESKAEMNRQSLNGLMDAINKLANSILALASSHDHDHHHHHQHNNQQQEG